MSPVILCMSGHTSPANQPSSIHRRTNSDSEKAYYPTKPIAVPEPFLGHARDKLETLRSQTHLGLVRCVERHVRKGAGGLSSEKLALVHRIAGNAAKLYYLATSSCTVTRLTGQREFLVAAPCGD